MSQGYLFTRGIVRAVFWGSVSVGAVVLVDRLGAWLISVLPY
jgi:hypothetical protein